MVELAAGWKMVVVVARWTFGVAADNASTLTFAKKVAMTKRQSSALDVFRLVIISITRRSCSSRFQAFDAPVVRPDVLLHSF